jgi:hypothetical protein
MARKSRTTSSTPSIKRPKRTRPAIPEPFQLVSSVTLVGSAAKIEVPMLVLYGEWLKALGFPIGSAAIVTTDKRGELALHRLGLGVPRRVRIRALPR